MTTLGDELRDVTNRLHTAWTRERQTRTKLLRFHAWKCIIVGALISVGGAASSMETQIGVWTRPTLAGLGIIAGALLLLGTHRSRSEATIAGLLLTGVWDLALAAGFILAALKFNMDTGLALRAPWDLTPMPLGQPVLYAPAVYFALVAMVWTVHLAAALDERRAGDTR